MKRLSKLVVPCLAVGAIVCILAMTGIGGDWDLIGNSPGSIEHAQSNEARSAPIKQTFLVAKKMNQESITESLINTANPQTWEAAITRVREQAFEVSAALIAIAKDKTRSNEDRRKAIFLLGKMDNKKSLDFLIRNITLRVQMDKIKGDEDNLKRTPCAYALRHTGNWKAAQAVFGFLDTGKSILEQIHFAGVLKSTLGRNLAEAAIEEQLHRTSRPITAQRRENLEAIKVNLD
jgi:hypothetical protein